MSGAGTAPATSPSRLPWVVAVIAAALLVGGLWRGSHANGDEVIYLQMAREMARSGELLDLQWMGEVAPQRPPLAIWLLATAEVAAPGSLMAQRMPSMLMGALCLLLTFLLGRRLTGCARTAALGVLLLLAANTFYHNARSPMTDTTALAGILAALYAWLRARERPGWTLAAGASLGWVLMTKHALVVIPLGIMAVDLLQDRRWAALRTRGPWLGAAAALGVAGPWHLIQTLRHGAGFWREYLGFNVAGRMTESLYVAEDPLYYGRHLVETEGLLALVLGVGLGAVVWAWARRREHDARFLVLWFVVAFLPFQLSATRLPHYLLPALVPASLAAARLLRPLLGRPLVVVAAVLAALTLFFQASAYDLLQADFTPDQRSFAAAIRDRGAPAAQVVAFNVYELALFHDLDRPVRMLTDDDGFFGAVDAEPILHRAGAVTRIPRGPQRGLFDDGPVHCITRLEDLPFFCGPGDVACGSGGLTVERGLRHALVSNALRPREAP
ncbi:MAG: glycosyltransferase family 39 protein [Pseudomonadota bacterium]